MRWVLFFAFFFCNFETTDHDAVRLVHAVMQTYLYSEYVILCGLCIMLRAIFVLFFKNIFYTNYFSMYRQTVLTFVSSLCF